MTWILFIWMFVKLCFLIKVIYNIECTYFYHQKKNKLFRFSFTVPFLNTLFNVNNVNSMSSIILHAYSILYFHSWLLYIFLMIHFIYKISLNRTLLVKHNFKYLYSITSVSFVSMSFITWFLINKCLVLLTVFCSQFLL